MWNQIRIEAKLPNFFPSLTVVGFVDRVGQQELRFAIGSVSFDGDNDCGANENAIVRLFGDYDAAFFNAETLAQLCGNDDRASLADFCRFHSSTSDT